MNPSRRRRRTTLFALRGLRLLQQHYLTLLSAAVIAALAVVALRSDAFQSSGRTPELPPLAQNPPDGYDIGLQFAQSILWSPPSAELGLRSVVYFIYETEMQRNVLERGLSDLSRARFKLDVGGPEDTNVFIRVATPQEETEAQAELLRAQELAQSQGYSFQVIDLRASEYN